MKLTLIMPKWKHGLWKIRVFRLPPLSLIRLASSTSKEWKVEIIDENIEKIKYDDTDLVAISAMTPLVNRAYEIADTYRKKGVKVVLGGIHPSVVPMEAIKHANSVVIGEADLIWKEVLNDFKNDKLKRFYKVKKAPDLSKLSLQRKGLVKNKYFFPNFIQSTRGCPFGCDFCSVSSFSGKKIRNRPVDQVVKEIKNFKGLRKKHVFFADDNIAANPAYAKKLFKALKPLKMKWASQASINIARDEKLLKLAADSGCKALFIGFESINQNCLKEIHKGYYVKEYKKLINRIHDHGISIEGAFMFGFDHDDKSVFKKTLDFFLEVNFDFVQLTPLTPLPGTKRFERLKKEKRIFSYNWDKYDCTHVIFKPKKMSVKELRDGINWCYENFYSRKSVRKRMLALMPKLDLKYLLLIYFINRDYSKIRIS